MPAWLERRQAKAEEIGILAADAEVVALFFALETQWRRHAMSGERLGIDYAAIRPTAELYDLALSPEIMSLLRRMECAALLEWSKKRA